jgi:hypothetical protein
MEPGSIYVLVNESMPGLVKIGFTTGAPESRAKELSRPTGIPTPFVVTYAMQVSSARDAEREAHRQLSRHRSVRNREFFKISVVDAIAVVNRVASKYPSDQPAYAAPTSARQFWFVARILSLTIGGAILLTCFGLVGFFQILKMSPSARTGSPSEQLPGTIHIAEPGHLTPKPSLPQQRPESGVPQPSREAVTTRVAPERVRQREKVKSDVGPAVDARVEAEETAARRLRLFKPLRGDLDRKQTELVLADDSRKAAIRAEIVRLREAYRDSLQRIIRQYPDTKAANEAKELLDEL